MPVTVRRLVISALLLPLSGLATSNYEYADDEYVTIARGISPNGKYAITAHGEGEYGNENFHIFLTDAVSGKKIGPLEEISDTLDTGAGAFCAKWSEDSQHVLIVYRIDRHMPLQAVSYRIANRRAHLIKGPLDVETALQRYWQKHCMESKPSPKTFGTPGSNPKR